MPELIWDVGTAYDMFISLEVLHDPGRYGLRGSWAAGVRSRLPGEERELLQRLLHNYLWPLPWVTTLPNPKDGRAVLQALAQIPAAGRLRHLAACHMSAEMKAILFDVADHQTWDERDKEALRVAYQAWHKKDKRRKMPSDEKLSQILAAWSQPEASGEGFLSALRVYYEVFFAEEEGRIRPALKAALVQAQELAEDLSLPALLEELSQGLRFTEPLDMLTLTLAPSFWITPLALLTPVMSESDEQKLFVFGARPADVSLVPGEAVPDQLFQALKALADPTRLRILHYLTAEPLTPAQLSRRLRLRAPTVIHHLHALRLARLVHLTIGQEGRRYEARREAVKAACAMLNEYLERGGLK